MQYKNGWGRRTAYMGAVFLSMLPLWGHAEESADDLYLVAGMGRTTYQWLSAAEVAAFYRGDNFKNTTAAVDNVDSAWRLMAGFQVTTRWALEVGYRNDGMIREQVSFRYHYTSENNEQRQIDLRGTTSLAIAGYEIAAVWTPRGRVAWTPVVRMGVDYWNASVKSDLRAPGGDSNVRVARFGAAQGVDIVMGVGARYRFNKQYSLRGEWQRIKVDTTNMDSLQINLLVTL